MGNSVLTNIISSMDAASETQAPARPGFQSAYLPGLYIPEELLAKEAEVLAPLCLHGQFPQPASTSRSTFQDFPQLLEEACQTHRATLLELQSLMLPPWRLYWGTAFPSKSEMFAFAGRQASADCIGELTDLSLSGRHLNIPDEGLTITTGRWAVLLDGTAVVRLMSGTSPGQVRTWADLRTISAALRGLREVRWSPALHWAFPPEYRRRLLFLCCLGKRLRLSPIWEAVVLPFFACASLDELGAASWGMRRPGQRLAYYSPSNAGWMPCRILATDPARKSIMIDVKPGYWLSPAEQASRTRAPESEGAAAPPETSSARRLP